MRELRRDPTTGDWLVLSTERMVRPPHLVVSEPSPVDPADCPLCPGNEGATGQDITRLERGGRWSVRVVPNRLPSLRPELGLDRRGFGPYDKVSGVGAHEVIVESREHVPVWEQEPRQLVDALRVARDRVRDLAHDTRFRYISWFRDHRAAAGASLHHPHSQVVALPVVPRYVVNMVERCQAHLARTERELFQDLVDHDRHEEVRVVRDADQVLAVCPWAPRTPFETWLVPTGSEPSFGDAPDDTIDALGRTLREVLRALVRELDDPPHSVVLYTAPRGARSGFRWHLRVMPRLSACGGFDLATGSCAHAVPPEEAARVIRGALDA